MTPRIRKASTLALFVLTVCFFLPRPSQAQTVPPWPADSVIYTIYPNIFSPKGNFNGITAQLGRLKTLGVTDIWVMPVTPIGRAVNGHPSVDSPYAVQDFYAVNPQYGKPADLHALITKAHALGLRVLLDEVLNHTAWDNALITQHPEYYVHSDSNAHDPASIKMAFNYSDVAQLNYANPDLRTYIIHMLQYWITQYKVDGFRFDTADDPDGPNRMIPADFWQALGVQLRQTKPDVLLLGEENTPDLAQKPFALDYGWGMYGPVKDASNHGGDAAGIVTAWHHEADAFPASMKHMFIQDDWDNPRDVNTFGGPAGAQAVAVFNFTDTGVPLLYNGMEIGNAAQGTNPHDTIDWGNGYARFPQFYHDLIALRRANPALQEGTMTWLSNSMPKQVLTYLRSGGGSEFLVEINLSSDGVGGTVTAPAGAGWTEVPIAELSGAKTHAAPPQVSLAAKEFAIFRRPAPKQ